MNKTTRMIVGLLCMLGGPAAYFFLRNQEYADFMVASFGSVDFNWGLGLAGVLAFVGVFMFKASLTEQKPSQARRI